MAEEFARCLVGIIRMFFVVLCPMAGSQQSIEILRIVGIVPLFLTKLERGSEQTPYCKRKTLFEAIFGKVFCKNPRANASRT